VKALHHTHDVDVSLSLSLSTPAYFVNETTQRILMKTVTEKLKSSSSASCEVSIILRLTWTKIKIVQWLNKY